MQLDRLLLMTTKEFRQIGRDKRILMLSLLVPVLLMALVGYAYTNQIKHVTLAVDDEDTTPTSILFTNQLLLIDTLHVTHTAYSREQAEDLIRDGKVSAAVVIPKGFESDCKAGRGEVYLLLDGSDPIVAGVVAPALDAVARNFSPGLHLDVTDVVLFNPNLRYFEFLVPSLVGLVVQFFPTFLVMFSLTGEKAKGTIEQLVVTPIEGFEILLGKMIAYVIVGFVDAFLTLGVAVFLFGMPIRGSIVLVGIFMLVFIIASVSLGTLSSVFASNQIEGFLQMVPLIILSVFLSGLIYPLESMSSWLIPVSYVIPQTYMNDALRSLITKGAGFEVVSGDLAALGVYTCVVTALATRFFRKRLG
jgi:ABC-2 type transport system permease protein